MKKKQKNLKVKNQPTTTQMKLLHWLILHELSEGSPDDAADLADRLPISGSL